MNTAPHIAALELEEVLQVTLAQWELMALPLAVTPLSTTPWLDFKRTALHYAALESGCSELIWEANKLEASDTCALCLWSNAQREKLREQETLKDPECSYCEFCPLYQAAGVNCLDKTSPYAPVEKSLSLPTPGEAKASGKPSMPHTTEKTGEAVVNFYTYLKTLRTGYTHE